MLTVEEFKKLGRIIGDKANPYNNGMRKARYPLSGLVCCGLCGGTQYSSKCKGIRDKRSYIYYRCKNIPSGCYNRPIREELIMERVNQTLITRYREITKLATLPPEQKVNPQLITLEKQLSSLMALPIINENVARLIEQTKQEIKQINNNEITQQETTEETIKLLEATFSNPLYWHTLPLAEKREIYHQLVNKVVIGFDKSEGRATVERIDLLI